MKRIIKTIVKIMLILLAALLIFFVVTYIVHRVKTKEELEVLQQNGLYNPVSVEDYRKALKNSGVEGPYILMPHSIGGVYATYWCSQYPVRKTG